MPNLGDMKSTDKKEIKKRLRAIEALLNWKETTAREMREGYMEKLRKVTTERDMQEKKTQRLEKRIMDLDKEKSTLEYKVKELETEARTTQRSSLNQIRGQAAGKANTET